MLIKVTTYNYWANFINKCTGATSTEDFPMIFCTSRYLMSTKTADLTYLIWYVDWNKIYKIIFQGVKSTVREIILLTILCWKVHSKELHLIQNYLLNYPVLILSSPLYKTVCHGSPLSSAFTRMSLIWSWSCLANYQTRLMSVNSSLWDLTPPVNILTNI